MLFTRKICNRYSVKDRVAAGDLGAMVTPINITAEKVNQTIGFNLSDDDIVNIFEQLGFETQNQNGQLTVNVPSRQRYFN